MLLFDSKIRAMPFVCVVTAAALLVVGHGHARVGVTSQTDGDPLGKPPTQAERVLRVGIDIQANEVITTKADDRAHIVFLDGTALTLAPNAQLVIDRFVYDPQTKTGDVAVSVATGVFRLVGGKISKTGTITVKTPAATIGLRGGIGLFVVTPDETRAHFLFGISMAVAANGRTELATRPGSLIMAKLGSAPTPPVVVSAGTVAQILSLLEASKGANSDKSADEKAKKSGFSASNSERGVNGTDGVGGSRGYDAQQAVSGADGQRQIGTFNSTEAAAPFFSPSVGSGGSLTGGGGIGGGSTGGGSTGGGVPGPTGGPPRSGPPWPATPAVGVGNGGLSPASPGGPRR